VPVKDSGDFNLEEFPSEPSTVDCKEPIPQGPETHPKLPVSTYLAFWVLFGNLDSPRAAAIAAVQDPSWVWNGREEQPIVEHHVEDSMHILQPIDLILLLR
jgi:hypothetical protein